MKIYPVEVEAVVIVDADGLDPITVFWCNEKPGVGSVTITCYGSSWTAWWGAMSGKRVQQFFAGCDSDYLTTNLSRSSTLKQNRRGDAYLTRIVLAVKKSLEMMEVTMSDL